MWLIISYFAWKFMGDFMIGVLIRIFLALILRGDVSWKGLFTSGIIVGILIGVARYYTITRSIVP